MSGFQKSRFLLAVLTQLAGVVLIAAVVCFELVVFIDAPDSYSRGDFLAATWPVLIVSVGLSLLGALLAVSVKAALSAFTLRLLTVPALISVLLLLLFFIGVAAFTWG